MIISRTCGSHCRKKLIPGIDIVPELYLKKYEKEMGGLGMLGGSCCPICLGTLGEGQFVVCMPCGAEHIFHRHCIAAWFAEHNVCPTCRAEFAYKHDISILSDGPLSPVPSPHRNIPHSPIPSQDTNTTHVTPPHGEFRITRRESLLLEEVNEFETVRSPLNMGTHQILKGQIIKSPPHKVRTSLSNTLYIYIYINIYIYIYVEIWSKFGKQKKENMDTPSDLMFMPNNVNRIEENSILSDGCVIYVRRSPENFSEVELNVERFTKKPNVQANYLIRMAKTP